MTTMWFAPPPLSLQFGGDVMLNGVVPDARIWQPARDLLRQSPTLANLEVPLTDARKPTTAKAATELKAKNQFILKAAPAHAPWLAWAGIRMVSLANNHAMDYGVDGLTQMTDLLRTHRIAYAGAGEDDRAAARVTVRRIHGVRVGLVSALGFLTTKAIAKTTPATDATPGVFALDVKGRLDKDHLGPITTWLAEAHRKCDVLVVAVHWGVERKTTPTPYQVALARALVDAGADVVWGNHPHVLQGAEIYRGAPILYSMGNLISALPSESGLVRVTFEKDRRRFRFFPLRVRAGRCEPYPAAQDLAHRKAFATLCDAVQRKYPNPESHAPTL